MPRLAVLFVVAGALIAAVPTVMRTLSSRRTHRFPIYVGAFLWTFFFLAVTETIVTGVTFLDATIVNLGHGAGRWGLFGPMLLVAGVAAVALREHVTDSAGISGARWILIGFIPLILISKLADGLELSADALSTVLGGLGGGARVGWGDSVNRMWMHVVFAVLFLLIARVSSIASSSQFGDVSAGEYDTVTS
jgi:hypothetical protein